MASFPPCLGAETLFRERPTHCWARFQGHLEGGQMKEGILKGASCVFTCSHTFFRSRVGGKHPKGPMERYMGRSWRGRSTDRKILLPHPIRGQFCFPLLPHFLCRSRVGGETPTGPMKCYMGRLWRARSTGGVAHGAMGNFTVAGLRYWRSHQSGSQTIDEVSYLV